MIPNNSETLIVIICQSNCILQTLWDTVLFSMSLNLSKDCLETIFLTQCNICITISISAVSCVIKVVIISSIITVNQNINGKQTRKIADLPKFTVQYSYGKELSP